MDGLESGLLVMEARDAKRRLALEREHEAGRIDALRFLEDLEALRASRACSPVAVEAYALFDELGDIYLSEAPARCEELRSELARHLLLRGLLASYVGWLDEGRAGPPTRERLRLALAALSMGGDGDDSRDLLTVLADLYVSAERAGFDPEPEFQELARRSSPTPPYPGGDSMRAILAEFHEYAVLAERRGTA